MEEPKKRPRKTKEEEEYIPLVGDDEGEGEKKPLLTRFMPLLVPLVIALIASYFMANVVAVPKGLYNNAVAGLSARMTAIETSMDDLKGLPESAAAQIQSLEEYMAKFQPNTDILVDLAVKVENFETQLAGLEIPSEGSLTTIIDDKIAVYEMALNDIKDDLETLWLEVEEKEKEEEEEEDEPPAPDETTVWTKEFWSTPELDIDYTISPSRVEDEEDYIIMVYLRNYDKVVKNDVVVDIIFSPKTGDRVIVDEAEIYLDSTRTPFYAWFGEVVKRSDDTCRRMVFTSEKMSIAAATGELEAEGGSGIAPARLTLRLEFTLAYK